MADATRRLLSNQPLAFTNDQYKSQTSGVTEQIRLVLSMRSETDHPQHLHLYQVLVLVLEH